MIDFGCEMANVFVSLRAHEIFINDNKSFNWNFKEESKFYWILEDLKILACNTNFSE